VFAFAESGLEPTRNPWHTPNPFDCHWSNSGYGN